MAQPYLSIVIPAHNEAERLPITLVEIDRYLSGRNYSYEIIAVNDASGDKTSSIVRKLAKVVKNLKLIENGEHKGKGAVVRQGMMLARGKIRVFMDADHSAPIEQIANFLAHFNTKNSPDIVIGSRAHKDSRLDPAPPVHRRAFDFLWHAAFVRPMFFKTWDAHCGIKAFTGEAADRIFPLNRIPGWGFDLETLSLAKALDMNVKEEAVIWKDDSSRRMPISSYLRILGDMIKIRWWLKSGGYGIRKRING